MPGKVDDLLDGLANFGETPVRKMEERLDEFWFLAFDISKNLRDLRDQEKCVTEIEFIEVVDALEEMVDAAESFGHIATDAAGPTRSAARHRQITALHNARELLNRIKSGAPQAAE